MCCFGDGYRVYNLWLNTCSVYHLDHKVEPKFTKFHLQCQFPEGIQAPRDQHLASDTIGMLQIDCELADQETVVEIIGSSFAQLASLQMYPDYQNF